MEGNNKNTVSEEITPKQKKRLNKKTIIIGGIVVAVAVVATLLYCFLYKIPHDQAVAVFNTAVEDYNTAVSALEEKNNALDAGIESLRTIVNADDLPIDETMRAKANAVLEEARSVQKDTAPTIPEMPSKTDDIYLASSEIETITTDMAALGNYSDTLVKLTDLQSKYETLIQQFQGATASVIWFDVDEEATVLRFVAEISNPNAYALTDVVTEWVAYNKNDAIVGSFGGHARPDIPAGESIYYVGGAGSANLSGNPDRVELTITMEGLLTERTVPHISVSDVQIIDNGYNWFEVTANCVTDADINTADLDGVIILRDADGQIIDADFWSADNLPANLPADGKFVLSLSFFDLPALPASAEVYVYYVQQ